MNTTLSTDWQICCASRQDMDTTLSTDWHQQSWTVPSLMLTECACCRFAQALTGPPREVSLAGDGRARRRGRSLLASAALAAWEVVADALRALWLLILFAPLAATAPLALQYGIRRQEWLEYLRCGCELIPLLPHWHEATAVKSVVLRRNLLGAGVPIGH